MHFFYQIQKNYIVTDIDYNAQGNITLTKYGNGASTVYSYYDATQNFLLQNVNIKTSTDLSSLNSTYTYDNVGNITEIDDAVDDIWDQVFVYDDLNRLTAQTNTDFAGGTASYTYNQIGNMMSKNGINYTYSSGTHQVITAGSNSYTYDANGNMATSPDRTYTYDYEDRLSSISGDISATYTYDGNGERVTKVENGITTYYINQYYEVRDSVGIKYYYANGQKVAQGKAIPG